MNEEINFPKHHNFTHSLVRVMAFLLIILFAGAILVDYTAAIYLVLGLIGGTTSITIIYYVGWKYGIRIVATLWIMVCSILATLFGNYATSIITAVPCDAGERKMEFEVTGFSAQVEPTNIAKGLFRVDKQLTYDLRETVCIKKDSWEAIPIKENVSETLVQSNINGTKVGLFVNEVVIQSESDSYDFSSCCSTDAIIEIQNLPYRSFYDAQHVDAILVDEYLGKETITWTQSNFRTGVRFAYIVPPYNNVYGLLVPFIEFSKFDNWVVASIGLIVSTVVFAVLKPIVLDYTKQKLANFSKNKDDAPISKRPKIKKKKTN